MMPAATPGDFPREPRNATTIQTGQWNPDNALALTQTGDLYQDFILKLKGMYVHVQGQNVSLRRREKPVCTHEFVQKIMSFSYIDVNHITGRTTIRVDEINDYNLLACDIGSDFFALEGVANLVSDNVWKICEELFQVPDSYPVKVQDGVVTTIEQQDNSETKYNWWKILYDIQFSYNDNFTYRHLQFIKKQYNLEDESFGQDIILRQIFWKLQKFEHLGTNRSLDATTLNHEKVIMHQTVTNNEVDPRARGVGMLGGIRDWVQRTIGGR